jgi:hypothetical protein
MTVKLTREEKETIINFNEGEAMVNVFTYNKRWQRRMKEMGVKSIRTEGQAKEYEFLKKWLRLPVKPRQLTLNERERRRKSLKLARLACKTTAFRPPNQNG